MRCSISRLHSAAGEPAALAALAALARGVASRRDSLASSYFDQGSAKVHHKGRTEIKNEGGGGKCRSLATLSLLGASGGSESMFSADFLTAAPCCRPAVAQGDANSLDRATAASAPRGNRNRALPGPCHARV